MKSKHMKNPKVVSRDEWLAARKKHLVKEKQLTRLNDELSRERLALPWVKIERNYVFETLAAKIPWPISSTAAASQLFTTSCSIRLG
jgi:predicted dithiol-disulfide oxidoreductase (DUF899 family)